MKRFPRFEICSHRQFRRQPAFVPSLCKVNYTKLTQKEIPDFTDMCQNCQKDFYYMRYFMIPLPVISSIRTLCIVYGIIAR